MAGSKSRYKTPAKADSEEASEFDEMGMGGMTKEEKAEIMQKIGNLQAQIDEIKEGGVVIRKQIVEPGEEMNRADKRQDQELLATHKS